MRVDLVGGKHLVDLAEGHFGRSCDLVGVRCPVVVHSVRPLTVVVFVFATTRSAWMKGPSMSGLITSAPS